MNMWYVKKNRAQYIPLFEKNYENWIFVDEIVIFIVFQYRECQLVFNTQKK